MVGSLQSQEVTTGGCCFPSTSTSVLPGCVRPCEHLSIFKPKNYGSSISFIDAHFPQCLVRSTAKNGFNSFKNQHLIDFYLKLRQGPSICKHSTSQTGKHTAAVQLELPPASWTHFRSSGWKCLTSLTEEFIIYKTESFSLVLVISSWLLLSPYTLLMIPPPPSAIWLDWSWFDCFKLIPRREIELHIPPTVSCASLPPSRLLKPACTY